MKARVFIDYFAANMFMQDDNIEVIKVDIQSYTNKSPSIKRTEERIIVYYKESGGTISMGEKK